MNLATGVRQIAGFMHPRTMARLRGAGMVDPRTPFALAAALPWLIGRGPSLGVASHMNAMVLGAKPALHDRSGTVTFKELDSNANRVANALRARGIRGGDRIALVLRNSREFAEVMLGAQKAGVEACPLNTWAKPRELEAAIAGAEPKLLIYDRSHAGQVEAAVPGDLAMVRVRGADEALPMSERSDSEAYHDLLASASSRPLFPFSRSPGAARVIIQTSGTTGTPKGAKRDSAAAGIAELANILAAIPYRRDDVIFCPAPMFHSFGLATLTFATVLGATVVLPEGFDPEGSLRMIAEHRATAASFVPVMIKRILDLNDRTVQKHDLSSLRIVLASGSAMSADLRAAANNLFGNTLYDLYGSTEAGWVAVASPDAMSEKPGCVGRPVPGTEVVIVSDDGTPVGADETGEIFVKSNVLFEGYTSGEARRSLEGFMTIGDLGHLDDDGYLYVDGRADDMVVIGGENVYPAEIEAVIEAVAGVREAAVLGVEDDEYGQVLAAFVAGDASEDLVIDECRQELASYKVPRRVHLLDELPRTSTGKVLKRELIEELSGAGPIDD